MRHVFFCLLVLGMALPALGQTSWKGTVSSSWTNSANWSNGVPGSTKAAVIGDAAFTGTFQPAVGSSSSCGGLTIGGTVAATLTLNKNLSVSGPVLINSNGTLKQGKSALTVSGDWTNNGAYSYTSNFANLTLTGTAATLSGSSANSFRKVTINANAVVTANSAFSAGNSTNLSGTLVPASTVTIGGNITVNSTGTLKVTAATLGANYSGTVSLNGGSTVEYTANSAQTVSSSYTYSTLRISGSGTRTLAASLPSLNSGSGLGNLYVDGGTLDLKGFTADRGSSSVGGTLSLANGSSLLLSGSANFPANFATYNLGYTSTVEYYGAAQTVSSKTYGNLTLSGSGAKTLPASTFTVSNALSLSGTVTATAGAAFSVSGGTNIGAGCTLAGASYALTLSGNLVNNGTLTGGTGSISIGGAGSTLSGSGTWNFNNLTVVASGVSSAVSAIGVSGNLATTGSGVFTHTGGTITMSGGATKTISGSSITLNDLNVTGTVSAGAFTLNGNLAVSGSFTTSGILVMGGTGKTISGAGTIALNTLSATGSLTTNTSFSIGNTLDVTGSLSASAGTVTFSGTCLYNGTSSLYNVALSGSSSLQLAANSSMGIAGTFTPGSGTLNASSTRPNTIIFNGAAQGIPSATYDNLTLTGGSKTAGGAIGVLSDLTINSGATLTAGSYSHSVQGNWINNGTFTAGSSTVSFTGSNDATITGATTFATLTIDKSAATNSVFLASNVSTPTLNMNNGILRTQTSKVSITGTRTGSGYIYGTIERVHTFTAGTSYAFEGSDNVINFSGTTSVSAVTMVVTQGSVSTFPFGSAINRTYTVSITGSYGSARLRLHYEDVELNGNSESGLQLYRYNGTSWVNNGVAAGGASSTANYAEQTGLTGADGTWTLSATANVVTWNGSVSSDWNTAANWTSTQGSPSMPPTSNEIVQIGTSTFTNQPVIASAAQAKSILFGSAKAVTLTLASGGSLTTQGNISGSWSANATHSIDVGAQTLTVNGNLLLSDGTTGHAINLGIGSGSVALSGSLTQSGGAAVTFTGAGGLSIGGDFSYSSGTFTPGSGTVTYNGGNFQSVGGVTYNQLVINKTAATATAGATTTVNGNLTVSAGTFDFSGPTTILGNVTIASGASATNRTSIQVGGNWINNGTYIPNGGLATFNGTGSQTISATGFNKIVINKASGTASLSGNITLNSDLLVQAGTLDLKTFTANRNTIGGTLQVANGASLYVGGTANFPANYTYYTFGASSNTYYNGTGTQSITGVSYGNLLLLNGGSNAKTLAAPTTVQGALSIASGATLDGSAYNLSLYGNWTNSGTFTGSTGAVLAMGSSKTITGNTTFNKLTVYGSYAVAGADITYNGILTIVSGGSFDAGSGTATLYGNLTNSGSLTSSGTTTFAGTAAQTIQLVNAIVSTSTGIINFNGSVAPVLNSTSTPTFATLNINNTAGVSPSVNWLVLGNFTVASGAAFNGGTSTHTISGNFTNNGVVTSNGGVLYFSPGSAKTVNLGANTTGNTFSSTGTVTFGGTGALTVSGKPSSLVNVVIANSNGVTPAANWSGISGTFTIADNSIFNAGTYTYTLAGNMESNGTLNGGTSNFTFTSATAQISGSPNTTFYDLLVNTGAALTINSEFNVSHDFTMNGTVDAALAGVTFSGAMNGNLTGSSATLTLADFDIEKTSGYVLTLQKNISGITDLNVTSGTLDAGAFALTQDGSAGAVNTLAIEDNARLRLGGTSAIPSFTQYALDSFSIVEYNGTTQALTPSLTYGCMEITAGTKTTSAALTLLKHMTISGGTLTGGALTHNVGGNWTQTGGTYTATGSTIVFNGVTAQTVTAIDAFNNVTLNNLQGLSLGSNVTVGGALALTTGKATLGAWKLTVSSGNLTSSSSNYVVATGAGTLVLPLAASSSKTFPVGTTTDYMPATVAFNAASTADNIGVRILTSAYAAGSSGGALSNYAVNATWMIDEAVAGGSNATVTLQWPLGRELPDFQRGSTRLAHYENGAWEYGTVALSASGSNPYTITRSGFTSFSPFSVRMYNAALPVTWLSFTGQRRAGSDELQWSTASETANSGFTVEAGSDGRSFSAIGFVAAAGNSSSVQQYRFTNPGVQGLRYYRIRQTDINGQYTYTAVLRLSDAATSGLQAGFGANPVRGNATLHLQSDRAGTVQLALVDAGGRALWQQQRTLGAGAQTVTIPLDQQAAGVYFLRIIDAAGTAQTLRLVKE